MEHREKIAEFLTDKFAVLKTREISQTQIGEEVLSDEGKPLSRSSISQYKAGVGVSRAWLERFCRHYKFDFPIHLFSDELTKGLTEAVASLTATQNAMAAQLTRVEEAVKSIAARLDQGDPELARVLDEMTREIKARLGSHP